MSSQKPDYFIASNGLPNILNKNNSTRHVIRQATTLNKSNRLQQRNLSCCLHDKSSNNNNIKCHKNKQNSIMDACKAPTSATSSKRNHLNNNNLISKKSKKDLINNEIKASSSHDISSTFSSSQKIEADSKCSWNIERYSAELDNKYTHQRKYDNKIFRHDLPDRIILPPLPT